jgi:RNA polymerase sigma-70 factor, ECF subfamily
MIEGRRVVAGEAILSRAAIESNAADCSRDQIIAALVREHSRLVYRIAYAVLRSHHDAEDAAQETFLRVLRYSAKLNQVEDRKSWLARIAWRVAVERGQRAHQAREIVLDDSEKSAAEPVACDVSADDFLYSRRVTAVLEKLIAALPRKLREPLTLWTVEEMTPREVAAVLKINEAAVRSRIFRARQILKEKLMQFEFRKQR